MKTTSRPNIPLTAGHTDWQISHIQLNKYSDLAFLTWL
jgi:hypothetical protein